ncbi:MAG: hypothetical protein KME17_16660 [Cyanosarcina radialis HA8281-LM2]|jgi:hypothetical protein|nr:hypothetical protein [Cyanosarcina radialis HA8281-LM2]
MLALLLIIIFESAQAAYPMPSAGYANGKPLARLRLYSCGFNRQAKVVFVKQISYENQIWYQWFKTGRIAWDIDRFINKRYYGWVSWVDGRKPNLQLLLVIVG